MSDEPVFPPASRLKLRLRTDKTAEEASLASPEPPASPAPGDQPPAGAMVIPLSDSPGSSGDAVAADSPVPPPSAIKLKPRISIKPSTAGSAGETIPLPGLLPDMTPEDPVAPVPPGSSGEKVKIDLGPLVRPTEGALPPGLVAPGRLIGPENAEAIPRMKLKPAFHGEVPGSAPPPPSAREINLMGLGAPRPEAAKPPPAGAPVVRPMPMLVPKPHARETPPPQKPKRHVLWGVIAGLLGLAAIGFLWILFRTPQPEVVVKPPTPRPPAAAKVVPRAVPPGGAEHSTVTDKASTGTRAGTQAAASAGAPTGSAQPSPVPSVSVNSLPPPPPVPSLLFRTFVDRLKISGVRTGPPARLFVDRVAYRPGDIIDRALGLVFVGVDTATDEIIFKDATGAVVRRRF